MGMPMPFAPRSPSPSSEAWLPKGINYRMHPFNIPCLTAARLDCCVLANNHVLDWGERGLIETLETLYAAGLRTAGASMNRTAAEAPAIVPQREGRRLLVYALGTADSGIPGDWAATAERPGLAWLVRPSIEQAKELSAPEQRERALRGHGQGKRRITLTLQW